MMLLAYLVKTILLSGLLFGYYCLFLKNRSVHRFNRTFLLAIPALSFALPLLHLHFPAFWNQTATDSPIRLLGVGHGTLEEAVTIYAGSHHGLQFSWSVLLGLADLIITGLLFARFFSTLRYLVKLRRQAPRTRTPQASIYFVSEAGTPFSFFRSVFWCADMDMESTEGRQILKHEIFHVQQFHSLDIINLELLCVICWFNPFFHLIRREMKAVHEYEADRHAAQDTNAFDYARLLLRNISGTAVTITNPFFKNQIKRRIAMITKSNKNSNALLGRILLLPAVAILICLFSFKFQNPLKTISKRNLRLVVDAGHGGSYTGALSDGQVEKDINLQIAKKIQALSKEYNVEVVMSRESDITPGGTDLRQSLEYIAGLPKKSNADLFVSIHTNATDNAALGKQQTEKSGFQIYIPRTSSEVYANSVKFGSVMTDAIKTDYTIESELKQPESGNVYILKNATVPALLIECGYMDNPNDMKYLMDEKNQEKIARDILEGVRKYGNGSGNITYTTPATNTGNAILHKGFESDTTVPFQKVEMEAEFPGGQTAWYAYLSGHLKYPDEAVTHEIQGTVVVEFIVKRDGSVTNVHVVSGPKALQTSAINAVLESGKWVPAKNGKDLVDSYKKQPFVFKLEPKS